MAKSRNYTREIQAQIREGRVPVNSIGPAYVVEYAPRRKSDPKPWTNGSFRYSGRYVHTEDGCRKSVNGTADLCGQQASHDGNCRTVAGGYIRYTYS